MIVNQQEWETYFNQFNQAHILQSAEWGALKSAFGWESVFVRDDKAGAMILFRKLPFGFTIAYIPEGPLGVPSDKFWNEVSEVCKQKKAIFLKVEPFVWQEDVEELDNLNLETSFKLVTDTVQPPSTIVIDLRDDEDVILARMKQKTRYNIRLAERKRVEVELSEELSTFHDLMKLTGERDAFGVHSEEYYQKAFDLFHTHGKCSLLIASFEGTPLAGVMVFTHGKNAWYLYGASSNEYRNLMPTYLIQWKAMLYAKSLGCEFYDLYGVPDADLETLEESFSARNDGLWGVYRFKRGFGGDLKRTVGAFDRVFKPVLYRMYQLYRKGL
jgi:lipid II:glycine glycyltransferase (peptidoglycan interpeptide bridge formation enzyme)